MARSRRELLLRVHRFRLRREDLEDCYSQAILELVAHARHGGTFASRAHIANTIEQRLLSRIRDRRRALGGRSPMQAAIETAVPLSGEAEPPMEVADRRAGLEELVMLRHDLRRVRALASSLSPDQRLVIASQLAQIQRCEFCREYGWTHEKYRKVAQRGRARLRALLAAEDTTVPPPRGSSEGQTGTNL